MIVYADATDLDTWVDGLDTERPVAPLLREASRRVGHACRNDLYKTQPDGTPDDDDLADAMRDAVCAQVEVWLAADVDPIAGAAGITPTKTVKTVDGVTIQYDAASATEVTKARAAVAVDLCDAALSILRAAGLASGLV